MAFTLQRKLELAGALSKVQPELQRLHLLRKRKKKHRLRNVILAGSGAIAVGAIVAVVVFRRRGCCNDAVAGNGGEAQFSPPEQATTYGDDREGMASGADGHQEVGTDDPN